MKGNCYLQVFSTYGIKDPHRLKKGVSVSVFVTVTSRKLEYPQTEL